MTEPLFSTATQLAAAIRAGQLSAVEVVAAHLDQIERHNPALNAIVTLDAGRAMARAQEADAARARGESWGPLHGVPFTLKDSFATAGMRTTSGFPPLTDYVPAADSTVAARLRGAGGILLGKTNVSELLADIQSNNLVFGRTDNPWDAARTPGGSSGGAAAALAAGMTPLEVGSDIGGSIRIPSHFCGTFGLKTTENRISSFGHIPDLPGSPRGVRIMGSIGPMARSIDDLALLYRLLAGPDGWDMEVQPVPVEPPPPLRLDTVRVAVAPTFPGLPVEAESRAAILALATALEPLCARVEEATLPDMDLDEALLAARALTGIITRVFGPAGEEPPVSLATYMEKLERRERFIQAWERFFEAWDVLLCPVSIGPAFRHCQGEPSLEVDGEPVPYWSANAHCKIFNYSGQPALVLPYRIGHAGLPIGVQLAAKRWDEARLLAIGGVIAEVTGPFRRPPGF